MVIGPRLSENPMRTTVALGSLLVFLAAAAADAACQLNVRIVSSPILALAWDPVPGATSYEVQESFDGLQTSRNYFMAGVTRLAITRRVSAPAKANYLVTARIASNVLSVAPRLDACTENMMATLPPDPELRRLTRKAVLPIVGSAVGAFGSRFKTSLKLTATTGFQRGKVVFHPAGAVAADGDPSIRYDFGGVGESVFFEDVVAEMGQGGIGTLDIVPDEDASQIIPEAEARLFNDTVGGTFGTYESPVFPFDYLNGPSMTVEIPVGSFRVNVGLRTLTDVTARILVYGTDKRLREFRAATYPADYMTMGNVAQMIGRDLAAGESFTILFDGAVIPFYTITENRTNDPAVFIIRRTSSDVGNYIE